MLSLSTTLSLPLRCRYNQHFLCHCSRDHCHDYKFYFPAFIDTTTYMSTTSSIASTITITMFIVTIIALKQHCILMFMVIALCNEHWQRQYAAIIILVKIIGIITVVICISFIITMISLSINIQLYQHRPKTVWAEIHGVNSCKLRFFRIEHCSISCSCLLRTWHATNILEARLQWCIRALRNKCCEKQTLTHDCKSH